MNATSMRSAPTLRVPLNARATPDMKDPDPTAMVRLCLRVLFVCQQNHQISSHLFMHAYFESHLF